MFYIMTYENEDIMILDNHVDKNILGLKLKAMILDFFRFQKIELSYDELFAESDSFYLVKNQNDSISLYQKTIDTGYVYNTLEIKEVRVYYIKQHTKGNKVSVNLGDSNLHAQSAGDLFTEQKMKLKKTVIIRKEKKGFNLISELMNNSKFQNLRRFTNENHLDV
jgi:hypothetical protein